MITKDQIKLCAENISKSINMKKDGEFVLIRGGDYSKELLEEIGLAIYRKGGIPFVAYNTDYYTNTMYQDEQIKLATLEKVPGPYLEMIKNIDAYIIIEPREDPSVTANAPRNKLDACQKSTTPVRDVLYGLKEEYAPGKKWCYAAWPSKKAADYYNIDYDLFEHFIVGGMSIPSEQMNKITSKLGKFFNKARKVHVTDDFGTDFWVSIENRVKILDDGVISDEQIKLGDLGGNLPAGEVFFPPHENQGEGKLICPLTKDRFSDKIIRNVELTFKEGRLNIDKVTADNNLEDLITSFKKCEEIDRNNNVPELRTYNVAELGIGCNPEITKAIGYILTDEKINGSVHLAFGFNKSFGGTSASQMHWDFVTAPKVNMIVEYMDGSKKIVMEKGKLIDE